MTVTSRTINTHTHVYDLQKQSDQDVHKQNKQSIKKNNLDNNRDVEEYDLTVVLTIKVKHRYMM